MANSGISATNRADFNWIPMTDALTGAAKWFGAAIDQLPINTSYFVDADGNKRVAVGLTANLSIGNRISLVRALADLNSSTSKTIGKFFPIATLGGAISFTGPDIEDAIKLDVGLPPVLDHALSAWENGLGLSGKADFTLDPHLTLEVHDSTNSADPESAIDTMTKYSAGITISFKGGEVIDGSISYESSMRFIHVEIDGEMQTVVAEHRTTSLDADQAQLAAAGVDLNQLTSDGGTWYFYNFNTHQPVELAYDRNTNTIVPLGSTTDITPTIQALDPNDPNAIAQVQEIVVTGRRTGVPEALTGQTSDGRYINVSTGRSEYDDPDGTKIISVGARAPDQASSQLVRHADGSQDLLVQAPGDIFGKDDQTYDIHVNGGDVTINGVQQSGDFAKVWSEYSKALSGSDKDAQPPVVRATSTGLDFQGLGSHNNRHTEFKIENGLPVEKVSRQDGASYWVDVKYDQNGHAAQTDIHFSSKPLPVEFSTAGAAIGETLGTYLAKGDVLTSVVLSSTLKTLGDNFGDAIDGIVGGENVASAFDDAFGTFEPELLSNLKSAGLGAISSFLAAELVGTLGIHGEAGVVANSAASFAINSILTNILNGANPFAGFSKANLANIENFAGAFVGTQLANAIGDWDEIGEQLGSSIGSTLGAIAGQALIDIPGIGAAIGAFIGDLIGGLIGGLFTGKPESGAIVGYDATDNAFAVTAVWKQDGGKKAVARALGNSAADALNGIISSVGGTVVNGSDVDAGSYGMRSKAFVYWEDGTSSDNRIKFDTVQDLLSYGVMHAAEQMQFIGGDVFAKRAFYNTIARGIVTSLHPDTGPPVIDGVQQDMGDLTKVDYGLDVLLGNLSVAQRLEVYLNNTNQINALMAAEPDSVFTAEWMLVLSQASDLGLLKRNAHDWDGGLSYFFGHAGIDARQVTFSFETFADGVNGERVIYVGATAIGDTIDSAGQTVIQGGSGDDVLTALSGGTRSDDRPIDSAQHIANVFQGGTGNDMIIAGDTGDDLFGGEGNDVLVGGALDDWLIGGAGNDVLDAGGGNANVLSGGDGDDFLLGADTNPTNPLWGGSDWLQGDDGNDRIEARSGDDYIDGGAGDDTIDGGSGNDTVIFRKGDGHDELSDSGTSTAEHDVLDFGAGIAPSDVTVVAHSAGVDLSLLVGGSASSDRIDLRGAVTNLGEGLEEVRFTGGSWSKSDLASHTTYAKTAGSTVQGTTADETLKGTVYDDTLNGGGGHDTLSGGDGSDTYLFNLGDGDVTIDDLGSTVDVDAVVFGAGISVADLSISYDPANPNDIILSIGSNGDKLTLEHQDASDGSQSIEELRFADGTSLTLRDLYQMGSGPAFDGGVKDPAAISWDHVLNGGDGPDTFTYNVGGGNVAISESYWSYNDTLVFGAGIHPEDLVVTRDPQDSRNVWIRFAGQPGSILLNDQDASGGYGIETIQFADGTTWDRTALSQHIVDRAASGGSDVIYDGWASTTISAGAGNDVVYAGDGNDAITGGTGDDDLYGQSGDDTYVYNLGDGNDRISEGYYEGGNDTLQLGAGITPDDLILTRDVIDSRNVLIRFAGHEGSIILDDQGDGNQAGIEHIQFADGTVWDRATIDAKLVAQAASALSDIVRDSYFGNAIATGAGNDVVYAGDGNDTITGGTGDDDLYGQYGDDTYVYNLGDGNDRISEGYYEGGNDTLQFGEGINPDDLILTRDVLDSRNVLIRFEGHDGSIILEDQGDGNQAGIEHIQFADGTIWDRATIDATLLGQALSAQGDILRDSYFGNAIATGAGNDVVYAGDGNDTITGGTGDDDLYGQYGDDTYVYNLGDGNDRISEGYYEGGNDTLQFGAGINPGDLILTRDVLDPRNVLIRFAGHDGSIILEDQGDGNQAGIEHIQFADGTIWDRATLDAQVIAQQISSGNDIIRDEYFDSTIGAGAGNDVVYTGDGNDTITGGTGDDDLYGQYGDDTYVYNLGDGNDRISEGYYEGGNDTLQFGVGINPGDLILTRDVLDPRNVLIRFTGHDGSIILEDQGDGNQAGVEHIQFADGTIWDRATLDAQVIAQQVSSGNDIIRDEYFGSTIDAGAGNDVVYADRGNDTITGGQGDDDLYGGTDSDTYIYNAGAGNDRITEGYSDGGTDTLVLGAGITAADLILTRDVLNGNDITISFANTGGSILLQDQMGGANSGIEQIQFADGTLWDRGAIEAHIAARAPDISGTNGDNDLTGTAGQDQIYGLDGDDTLRGGAGNDFLAGGGGDDTYIFNRGDGADVVYDDWGNDTVRFGAGISVADLVVSQATTDGDWTGLFIAIAGTSDRLYIRNQNANNGRTIERFEFADGTVLSDADMRALLVTGTSGNDRINGTIFNDNATGGAGNDEINTSDGDDTLTGGTGDDYLNGGGGNDTYILNRGDGSDTILDDSGTDTLRFGAGINVSDLVLTPSLVDGDVQGLIIGIAGTSDRIYIRNQNSNNGHGIESFVFADGTVLTDADLRAKLMLSVVTDGGDKVYGTSYDDVINGGLGDDEITSGDGNDVLTGGEGDDYLDGQYGDDTYVFNRGDGSDTILDDGGNDTLRFGAGISASDLVLTPSLVDGDVQGLIIGIAGTNDRIYIRRQNFNDGHGIEHFVFADGTVLIDADLRAKLMLAVVTDGDDKVYGTSYDDVINGGLGDDEITSGDGNDVLTGGKGDDYLDGQYGDDTYVFNRGDGSDTILDDGGNDTLRFGAGISASDLVLTPSLVDGDVQGLVIGIAGTSDRIYIRRQNFNDGHGIEKFVFADGTVLTDADLRAKLMLAVATDGDDKIYGTSYDDVIDGGNGNDEITSGDGNDLLTGGKGDDYLDGQYGNDTYVYNRGDGSDTILDDAGYDTLQFGEGIDESDVVISQALDDGDSNGIILSIKGTNDRIYLRSEFDGNRIDQVTFMSGAAWSVDTLRQLLRGNSIDGGTVAVTMGDDTITGSAAADSLRGMKGDDVLRGGAGSDIYSFARGDGHDTIYDPTDAASTDTLVLEGINPGDVRVMVSPADAEDLILYIDDDNVIYLDQQNESASSGIEQVRFADGTVWDRATLTSKASGQGTSGDDTLIGSNFADTLIGGLGNDTLIGSAGNDTYVYNPGDGDDTIIDDNGAGNDPSQPGNSGNFDTLAFGVGITLADLRLTQASDGAPLVISFASRPGSITLKGLDTGGRSGVELIRFADGSTVTMDQLRASSIDAAVTSGDDLIRGFGTDDTLDGGAGNDTLAGGAGADTYMFELGGGADTIVETADGSTNKLVFGSGIAVGDVRLVRTAAAPDDLVLMLSNGTDKVTIRSQFANGGAAGLQEVHFADGTVWLSKDFETILLAQPATPDADYLMGDDSANTIDGLGGDDVILGGAGDDTISGSDGNDTLYGGAGDDKLYGGAGDDVLSGDTGTDLLDGGDGFDIADYSFSLDKWSIDLAAGTAKIVTSENSTVSETLTSIEGVIGGLGSDTIVGSDGANRIQGGGGNDFLTGAGGDDVFVLDGDEDGVDAIDGGSGNDRIEAASDDTVIGLTSLANVELITANGHANVTIEATDDADTLDLSGTVLDGIVSIEMGGGNDVITSSLGADVIDAGDGDDTIRYVGVSTGGDQVDGSAGYDTIAAGADDTVIRLATIQNVEAISGGGFSNVVLARTDAGEVTDLNGIAVSGIAYVDLAGGDDHFVGTAQADVVRGGAGDDTLLGAGGNDVFQYSGTNNGFDTIDGGDGTDTLQAVSDGAIIGIRSISGIETIDGNGFTSVTIATGDGNDHLDLSGVTLVGISEIDLGAGDDTFAGSAGADRISAGAGNDQLHGGSGDDVLIGGAGNDLLVGGAGNDTYIFSGGDGLDEISDLDGDGSNSGTDILSFGTGIAATDVTVTRQGDDVYLTLNGGADQVKIDGETSGDSRRYIEQVQFADGTVWERSDLISMAVIHGTAGDDSMIVPSDGSTVDPGTGNDYLSASGAGGGTIIFAKGDGHDTLDNPGSGYVRTDVLDLVDTNPDGVRLSRSGNALDVTILSTGDTFHASWQFWGSGVEQGLGSIRFADGTVWDRTAIASHITVTGTDGNDSVGLPQDGAIVDLGRGDDYMAVSGTGGDRIIFAKGDGHDTLDNPGSGYTRSDVLDLIDTDPSDVRITRSGITLDVTIVSTGDTFHVDWQYYGSGVDYGLGSIRFADGTIWDRAAINAHIFVPGTTGNDSVGLPQDGATVDLGLGDDSMSVSGNGGDRIIFAKGDGHDALDNPGSGYVRTDVLDLVDTASNDVQLVRSGDSLTVQIVSTGDTFHINYQFWGSGVEQGIGSIRFADGTSWDRNDILDVLAAGGHDLSTPGNDTINGTDDGELLHGGAGDDTINGNGGNDTLYGDAGTDSLNGGSGDDTYIWSRGDGSDVIFDGEFSGGNDRLLIHGVAPADVALAISGQDAILTIPESSPGAADGGTLTLRWTAGHGYSAGIESIVFDNGTSWGQGDLQSLYFQKAATSGDDTINGFSGNDTIDGGAGNDTLNGNGGDDTYVWDRGGGNDVVNEGEYGGNDRLLLHGVAPADVGLAISGQDAILTIPDSAPGAGDGGSVTLKLSVGHGYSAGVETIIFDDGTTWSQGDLGAIYLAKQATPGDDTISGFNGNDTIAGGPGNDTLYGNGGNDTFVWSRGDGNDTIYEWEFGGNDTLVLHGVDPGDVAVSNSGQTAILTIFNSPGATDGGTLTLPLSFNHGYSAGIEQVLFDDGTSWSASSFGTMAATAGNDSLTGTAGRDWLHGLDGDDIINGADGVDVLHGDAGDDTLTGGSGNDTLDGGAGNDTAVYAGAIADYSVATSNGVVTVTDNQTTVDGDDGTDTLVGIETLQFKDGSTSLASPIVLDLNGDGVHLLDKAVSGARFGWNGDGKLDRTGWISSGDGLLAFDRNGDGTVSGADELSFVDDAVGATSDLAGLKAFDSSDDGTLSAADDAWSCFGVWSDVNGDGKVDPGEFLSMAQAGVASIDLSGKPTNEQHRPGENLVVNTGTFTRSDGSTAAFDDVAFSYGGSEKPVQGRMWGGPLQVKMPELDGAGAVPGQTADILANAERLLQATASFGTPSGAELGADNDFASNVEPHRWEYACAAAIG